MATSPTTKSALLSGAAKDDVVGINGDFTFSISDLLGNDPGGAAKVDVAKQFFFGDTAADRADQAGYLAAHHITDNGDGTYTINAGATDFSYFVQIGNKGTWSQGDVDVTAPDPVQTGKGALLFSEGFEGLSDTHSWEAVDLGAVGGHGWTNVIGGAETEVAWGAKDGTAYGGLEASEGNYWLDTQATAGPINTSHTFTDANGGKALLSFDIASEAFGTAAFQTFELLINGAVAKPVLAWDLQQNGENNQMHHFEVLVDTVAGADANTLTLHDTSSPTNIGFAIDNIQIHDWIV